MPHSYSKSELEEYFFQALCEFKECFDTDISRETVHLEFFTPENGVEVYERFCTAHFPRSLTEPYKSDGYFETFAAQAFVSEKEYGVLVRADIDFPPGKLLEVFRHEISHLYCVRNEISGGNFCDTYCMGTGSEDEPMNAGYAVWREAVADIMADWVMSEYTRMSLKTRVIRSKIYNYYKEISNAEDKKASAERAMSLVIAYVMISKEVAGTSDWSEAEDAIKRNIKLDDPLLYAILKLVFEKLHTVPFWEITPDFIMTLGETYLSLVWLKALRNNITE